MDNRTLTTQGSRSSGGSRHLLPGYPTGTTERDRKPPGLTFGASPRRGAQYPSLPVRTVASRTWVFPSSANTHTPPPTPRLSVLSPDRDVTFSRQARGPCILVQLPGPGAGEPCSDLRCHDHHAALGYSTHPPPLPNSGI